MKLPWNSKTNPWPLAIIAYFIGFMTFTVLIVGYLSHQKMDLVRGDYYDDEIRYQEQLDRLNRTEGIKDQVSVGYDRARDSITVKLPPAEAQMKIDGRIRLYRPSDESLDQEITLALNTDGTQTVDAKPLRAGLWKVRVYWSVNGQDYYFTDSVIIGPNNS